MADDINNDSIIFPIHFDLEAGVKQAEQDWGKRADQLQKAIKERELVVKLKIDTTNIKDLVDTIKRLEKQNIGGGLAAGGTKAASEELVGFKKQLAELTKEWEKLTAAERGSDAGTTLRKRYRTLQEEAKGYVSSLKAAISMEDKLAKTQRKSAEKASLAEQQRIAKEQLAEEKRYQKYFENAEKEAKKEAKAREAAEARRRAAENKDAHEARVAAHNRAQEAYKLTQALKAQEDVIANLTAKLRIYQQQIQNLRIGSDEWNKAALQIRRVTNELDVANQRMQDFQQKAFHGLSDTFTTKRVAELQRLRTELDSIDVAINKNRQRALDHGGDQNQESALNALLDKRIAKTRQINEILKSGSDLQIQREKEINHIIEQRKAKAETIAAKRKAETQAIQANIAKLKEERRILNQQETSVAAITAKLQIMQKRLNTTSMRSGQFERIAKEVERLTRKLEAARNRIAELTGQTVSGADRQSRAVRQVTNEYRSQDGYVSRLIKRLAVYASFSGVYNFLRGVREVTAQFELQRVSLGAILQDQNRANQLFSEIQSFALKSPLSIMDLTKYTKQVAAYGIETDKLFDTTKRLADVSVGLGVDMGRLTLAYGQVKAASYLRAAEIRQFTEAGIPMLELLADKFTALNGEAVTTEQVMEMVSKRMVSFSMVEDVFNDMTSAGGMFYNMQEKQSQTLAGMWAKLGDAASMMYNEIGNTAGINNGMKGLIQSLTNLMKNWRLAAAEATILGTTLGILHIRHKLTTVDTKLAEAATKQYASAQQRLNEAQARGNKMVQWAAERSLEAADAMQKAAQTTNAWTAAQLRLNAATNKFKAALAGNWIMLVIAVAAMFVTRMVSSIRKAGELKRELKEIEGEGAKEGEKSVRNIESLATAAVEAADGSRKQKEALDELVRTYGDIIPQERLTIENLRAMKGNYDSLTNSVRAYVAEQTKQKQIDAIIDTTFEKINKKTGKAKKILSDTFDPAQTERFLSAYKDILRDNPELTTPAAIRKAFAEIGTSWKELDLGTNQRSRLYGLLEDISEAVRKQEAEIDAVAASWDRANSALGTYGKTYKKAIDEINENPSGAGNPFDEYDTPYFYKQQQQNLKILKAMIPTLQEIMSDAKVAWDAGWANIVSTIDTAQPQIISSINFDAINKYLQDNIGSFTDGQLKAVEELQEMYLNMGIPSEVVQYNRKVAIDLANSMSDALSKIGNGTKTAIDNVSKYFMTSEQSVNDYAETLDDALEELKERIAELEAIGTLLSPDGRKELEALKTEADFVDRLRKLISPDVTSTSGGDGAPSDNRLSQLREIEQTLTTINSKYEELLKKEGQTKALADIQKIYGETLAYINQLGDRFGLKFDMPTSFETLQEYRRAIKDVIETLRMSGYEKAALELQTKIDTGDVDKLGREVEEKIKQLADEVSRTKTAKEFYDKILDMTGDYDLAANLSFSVYGGTGADLANATIAELEQAFDGVDISDAVNKVLGTVDYSKLSGMIDLIESPEGKKMAQQLVDAGMKANADWLLDTYKTYEKFKTFEEQRTTIVAREAEKRRQIEANAALDDTEKYRLLSASHNLEAEELNEIDWKEFKASEDWVKTFQDIDRLATPTIERLIAKLKEFIEANNDLTPEQLRTVMNEYDKLYDQLVARDPFKAVVDGIKEYKAAMGQLATARAAQIAAQQEVQQTQAAYDKAEQAFIKGDGDILTTGRNYTDALNKRNAAVENLDAANRNLSDAQDAVTSSVAKMTAGLNGLASAASNAQSLLSQFVDLFGIAEDSEVGSLLMEVGKWLGIIGTALAFVAATIQVINKLIEAEMGPIGWILGAVAALGTLFTWLANSKVRKANKEIERQQKIVEGLEKSYKDLERAVEDALGVDYIRNHNAELTNLYAQAEAARKMAAAERSKGKKADEEKVKEYEQMAEDAMDQIADKEHEVSEMMTSTDLTSAAKDWASAWFDAYLSFGDTTAAIEERFQDMMKNMVVNAILSRYIQSALKGFFDAVDKIDPSKGNIVDQLLAALELVPEAEALNSGLLALVEDLKAKGFDPASLRKAGSELTGISRNIATASEESINGLAQGINTQNFYISQIHSDVAMIAQNVLANNTLATPDGFTLTDLVTMQNQHLSNLPAIAANTAATVERCERAAIACEAMASQLSRVIKPKGTPTTFVVSTTIS